MAFGNIKAPKNLTGERLCAGFVSAKVSPISYLKYDLSFLMTLVLIATPLTSSNITCDCLVCNVGKWVEFSFLEALETACMLLGNVSNLGTLSIPWFKDDNSVGIFSISLSLALIFLAFDLIYTPLY